LRGGVFYGVNETIPVYIPVGTKNSYMNTAGWSEFTNMVEL